MNRRIVFATAFSAAGLVSAEEIVYQGEFSGWYDQYGSSWETGEFSTHYESTYTRLAVDASYFFTPIDTANVVQNELRFVRRADAATLHFSRGEYESSFDYSDPSRTDRTAEEDDHSIGLSGTRFLSDDLFVSGGYGKTLGDDDGSAFVGAGYYYGETSAVDISLSRSLDEDDLGFGVSTHTLLALSSSTSLSYTLGIEAEVDDFADSASAELGVSYYFTNHTGIGVAGNYWIEDEDFGYSLTGHHFFNDIIGIEVWLGDPDEGLDVFGATLTGRF